MRPPLKSLSFGTRRRRRPATHAALADEIKGVATIVVASAENRSPNILPWRAHDVNYDLSDSDDEQQQAERLTTIHLDLVASASEVARHPVSSGLTFVTHGRSCLVAAVEPGSPADWAGLAVGHTIIEANGESCFGLGHDAVRAILFSAARPSMLVLCPSATSARAAANAIARRRL